jgi:bacteriocin biosynthesis cyclodehydratase domain-containing protein
MRSALESTPATSTAAEAPSAAERELATHLATALTSPPGPGPRPTADQPTSDLDLDLGTDSAGPSADLPPPAVHPRAVELGESVRRLRRPRLLPGLPVLHRTPTETQIGLDRRYAALIAEAPPELDGLLRALDGRHTLAELLDRAGPSRVRALVRVLTELAAFGMLEDAADLPAGLPGRLAAEGLGWALRTGVPRHRLHRRRAEAEVAVHGSGRLALALAEALAAAGVGRVQPVAEGVVGPEDLGCGYAATDLGVDRRSAIAAAVRRVAPEVRCDPPPNSRLPELVVLTDAAVPDPRLAAGLLAVGVPHLLVHAGEGHGAVGPLVVPGRPGCVRCLHLHATDQDPAWPRVATQVAGRPQPADIATVRATSGLALAQVLRGLHGGTDAAELPCWGARIEVDTFTGRTERVPLPPHPRCSCRSSAQVAESTAGTFAEPLTSGVRS